MLWTLYKPHKLDWTRLWLTRKWFVSFCDALWSAVFIQGEMGLPGTRGLEGAPGKGIPGEKVTFNQSMVRTLFFLIPWVTMATLWTKWNWTVAIHILNRGFRLLAVISNHPSQTHHRLWDCETMVYAPLESVWYQPCLKKNVFYSVIHYPQF